MKRGRKPKVSVTFYMRSSMYGDIKMLFSYKGERYSLGSTYISLMAEEFDMLKPNGEHKDNDSNKNPKLHNGIYISDLLVYLRNFVIEKVEERLSFGESLTESYVRKLSEDAAKAMSEQIGVWSSNLEWNKGLAKALRAGEDAVSDYYKNNLSKMFSLDIKSDEQ